MPTAPGVMPCSLDCEVKSCSGGGIAQMLGHGEQTRPRTKSQHLARNASIPIADCPVVVCLGCYRLARRSLPCRRQRRQRQASQISKLFVRVEAKARCKEC